LVSSPQSVYLGASPSFSLLSRGSSETFEVHMNTLDICCSSDEEFWISSSSILWVFGVIWEFCVSNCQGSNVR
jgi:hypothetical protein